MAGQLTISRLQIGDSTNTTQNFVFTVPTIPDGTMKLSRGNVGNTTQDIMTVDPSGIVNFPIGGGAPTLTDDNTTNSTRYLTFADSTTGHLLNTYTSSTKLTYNPSTGTVTATTFVNTSDETLKTNITLLTNSLDIVNKMEGVSFNWKDTGIPSYGVIAQQIETVLPHIVHKNAEGVLSVEYSAIIGFLIESIKELSAKVYKLEHK